MKKNYFFVIMLILSVIFLINCDKTATSPVKDIVIPAWDSVDVTNIGYNTLKISSDTEIKISKKIVEEVVLLLKENNVYKEVQRIEPNYEKNNDDFYLQFEFIQDIDIKVVYCDLRVDFLTSEKEKTVISVEKTQCMLKYPYENTEVFVYDNIIVSNEYLYFQDFDFIEEKLYFHCMAPNGLFVYDTKSYQTEYLLPYGSGDFIASANDYVFFDISPNILKRYNTKTKESDFRLDFDDQIQGVSCYNEYLYVCLKSNDSYKIAKFDFDGVLISEFQNQNAGFYMTIHNDIAYSVDYQNDKINRFNITNGETLSGLPLPAKNTEGICIDKEIFFYIDYDRNLIGYVWLGNMIEN